MHLRLLSLAEIPIRSCNQCEFSCSTRPRKCQGKKLLKVRRWHPFGSNSYTVDRTNSIISRASSSLFKPDPFYVIFATITFVSLEQFVLKINSHSLQFGIYTAKDIIASEVSTKLSTQNRESVGIARGELRDKEMKLGNWVVFAHNELERERQREKERK